MRTHQNNEQELTHLLASPPTVPAFDFNSRSELMSHKLNVTAKEKALTATNAAQESLGTAGFLSALHIFIFYTSLEEGGIGLTIGAAAGIGALSALSVATLAITIPLSYMTYRNYIRESTKLEAAIIKEEVNRKRYRDELFLDLLILKCLCDDDDEKEFQHYINQLNLNNAEINKANLLEQVNAMYLNPAFRGQAPVLNDAIADFKNDNLTSQSLAQRLANSALNRDREERLCVIQELKKIDQELDEKIYSSFQRIPIFDAVERGEAIAEGVNKALCMGFVLFSTITTFVEICITAGFCAALAVTGWGAIIIALVIACAVFGAGVGLGKQKNLQREELQNQLHQRNGTLIQAKRSTQTLITQKLRLNAQKAEMPNVVAPEKNNIADLQTRLAAAEKQNTQLSASIKKLEENNAALSSQLQKFTNPPANNNLRMFDVQQAGSAANSAEMPTKITSYAAM